MKAILYVGGALMVAASIYGFIDYKKSNHDKKFRTLYENKKEISIPEKRESNSVKEEPSKVAEVKAETTTLNDATVKQEELKANSNEKPVAKKKRKVRLSEFSRAPLDEKYLKEEIKVEPKKKEVKVEKKDQ